MKLDEILDNMPEGLSKNYMLRYLYLELGKIYRRDTKFFYGTEKEKVKIYDRPVALNDKESMEIICKSIGAIYKEAFEKVGIQAECVSKSKSKYGSTSPYPHIDMIVEGENGKRYYLNPMDDLYRIQMGLRTKRFGTRTQKYDGLDYFEEAQIKEMDDFLGYTFRGLYTDEVLEFVRKDFLDRSKMKKHLLSLKPDLTNKDLTKEFLLEYKLDFIFQFLNFSKDMRGYIELIKGYNDIFSRVLNQTERRKIKKHNMYTTDEDGKRIMQAVYQVKFSDKTIYYVLSNNIDTYIKLSPTELIDYMEKEESGFIKDRKEDPEEER